jgi:hypothetical protein
MARSQVEMALGRFHLLYLRSLLLCDVSNAPDLMSVAAGTLARMSMAAARFQAGRVTGCVGGGHWRKISSHRGVLG